MYLSMWILHENLKHFHSEAHIMSGDMCIRNASPLYQADQMNPHTVYICPSEDVFSSMADCIICVNGNDYLILRSVSMEDAYFEICRLIDLYMEWDMNVQDMIKSRCSLQEITEFSSKVLHRMLAVEDSTCIYEANAGSEYTPLPEEIRRHMRPGNGMPEDLAVMYVHDLSKYYNYKNIFVYEDSSRHEVCLILSLIYQNKYTGCVLMFLGKNQTPSPADVQLFHTYCSQVSSWKQFYETQVPVPLHEKILLDLLDGRGEYSQERTELLFARLGWSNDDEKYLLTIREIFPSDFVYYSLMRAVTGFYPACLFLQREKELLLLINARLLKFKALLQKIQSVSHYAELHIGVSYSFRHLDQLLQAYRQTDIAQRCGARSGQNINFCGDYLEVYASEILSKYLDRSMAIPELKKLKSWDSTHSSEYCRTLKIYLEQERRLEKAAAKLQIHVNTLKYRIRKITELTGLNLDCAQVRSRLLISFMLLQE